MGATIKLYVGTAALGPAMQALEHAADIHLIGREPFAEGEQWTLRSEHFPAELEGERLIAEVERRPEGGYQFAGFIRNPETLKRKGALRRRGKR